MIHACDDCYVKNRGVGALVPAAAGTTIVQHLAVRPDAYPSTDSLASGATPWPSEPPYCVECGHEMLTEASYDAVDERDNECHSQLDLEVGGGRDESE